MKRLALPGGGFFEIPLPKGGRFVEGPLEGAPTGGGKVGAVLGGAILGALITWAIIELID